MLHPPSANSARISEIFSSLQGEGTHLGERHLFVRFEECHIHCNYCDELDKPGTDYRLEEVLGQILKLEAEEGPHRFVSLTGGEPLLYVSFLKALIPRLKEHGFRVYLETNGILWQALEDVVGWCDCIAMDMKPASVTKEANYDKEHRRFLAVAKSKQTFVKIIVSRDIFFTEFESQMRIIAEMAPHVPVVLVPISDDIEGHENPELMRIMGELQRIGARYGLDVRIVPRFHKILGIR